MIFLAPCSPKPFACIISPVGQFGESSFSLTSSRYSSEKHCRAQHLRRSMCRRVVRVVPSLVGPKGYRPITATLGALRKWGWGSSAQRVNDTVGLPWDMVKFYGGIAAGDRLPLCGCHCLSMLRSPVLTRTFLLPPVSWTFTKRRVYLSLFMARPLLLSCQYPLHFIISPCT